MTEFHSDDENCRAPLRAESEARHRRSLMVQAPDYPREDGGRARRTHRGRPWTVVWHKLRYVLALELP